MSERDRLFLQHMLAAVWAMVEQDLPTLRRDVERILGRTGRAD